MSMMNEDCGIGAEKEVEGVAGCAEVASWWRWRVRRDWTVGVEFLRWEELGVGGRAGQGREGELAVERHGAKLLEIFWKGMLRMEVGTDAGYDVRV